MNRNTLTAEIAELEALLATVADSSDPEDQFGARMFRRAITLCQVRMRALDEGRNPDAAVEKVLMSG